MRTSHLFSTKENKRIEQVCQNAKLLLFFFYTYMTYTQKFWIVCINKWSDEMNLTDCLRVCIFDFESIQFRKHQYIQLQHNHNICDQQNFMNKLNVF